LWGLGWVLKNRDIVINRGYDCWEGLEIEEKWLKRFGGSNSNKV
jgi:hypothetical protein